MPEPSLTENEQPTIHEGYIAQAMERRGLIADRCEINRQIKADNALIRELKAAVKKIAQSIKMTIPALAEAMETLREKVIVICYHILHTKIGKRKISDYTKSAKAVIEKYKGVVKQISDKKKERKELQKQKESTPVFKIISHRDLARRIAELSEEIEELISEKAQLLNAMKCADDKGVSTVQSGISKMESALAELDKREAKYTAELNEALQQYSEYKNQAKEFDIGELGAARLDIRPEKQRSAQRRIESFYGDQYDWLAMASSVHDADMKLNDEIDMRAVRQYEHQQSKQQSQPQKDRSYHVHER